MSMTIRNFQLLVPVLLLAVLAAVLIGGQSPTEASGAGAQVTYPEGYRSWTHVKSMVILEGHVHFNAFGGFHHVYANEKALNSLKGETPFAKGAVLVFELRETVMEDNAITAGPRQVIGVMEKDPARFPATEGWGFEDFKFIGDSVERMVTDARAQCLSCHEKQKDSGYVYSNYRE